MYTCLLNPLICIVWTSESRSRSVNPFVDVVCRNSWARRIECTDACVESFGLVYFPLYFTTLTLVSISTLSAHTTIMLSVLSVGYFTTSQPRCSEDRSRLDSNLVLRCEKLAALRLSHGENGNEVLEENQFQCYLVHYNSLMELLPIESRPSLSDIEI
jgi:hypothetical protein